MISQFTEICLTNYLSKLTFPAKAFYINALVSNFARMKFIKYSLILLMAVYTNTLLAQVNGYAKVTNISDLTLTVNNVNETFGTFESGAEIIIMQMQDDIIGSNTHNNVSFGNINTIASTGLYETATITSINEVAGTPLTINLSQTLSNTYNIGTNSSVQIITFPQLGSPNYTTIAGITAVNWDGNVGGVVAFQVAGTLTLAHNISANNAGFRGGNADGDSFNFASCDNSVYRTNNASTGRKGEGIYKSTNTNYVYGRAKILSGGGGGSLIDAGGGGGSNFSSGGVGGWGYCDAADASGGYGGIDLSAYISGNRIFMGGGGGGGQINLGGTGGNGSNGGGIVLLKANILVTTGACGNRSITANGANATDGTSNGGGGAGAGGSVILQVNSFSINAGCSLTVAANGGNGGDADGWLVRGGGGGGGQGTVFYSGTQPTVNVTTNTSPGVAGFDNDFGSQSAIDGGGIDGQGVQDKQTTALPIELLYFRARAGNKAVILDWATIGEQDNDFFEIQRSANGVNWQNISKITGTGNSTKLLVYQYMDEAPLPGTNYYRLKQTDLDGSFTHSNMVSVNIKNTRVSVRLAPNPAKDFIYISLNHAGIRAKAELFDALGRKQVISFTQKRGQLAGNVGKLAEGMYLLKIYVNNVQIIKKVMIRR